MALIDFPRELAPAFWNPHKAVLAKLKNVPPQQIGEGLADLAKRHGAVDWALFDVDKIDGLAQAEARQKSVEDEIKTKVVRIDAESDSMADHADYFAKEGKKHKEVPKEPLVAAAAISKAAAQYRDAVKALTTKARADLAAQVAKLKAGEKKAGPGAGPTDPKAIADAKNNAAIMKKCISALRSPQGSPVPVRFFLLQEDKRLRVYLGPKPDSAFAKLKSQFQPNAKLRRIKDPKGTVIWEKSSLTFISEILKGGLAKQIQMAIREQTKLSVKVRIKKADGSVDEAESVPDLTDDQLKVDADDEAAIAAAGKDFSKRLAEMQRQIAPALKGPSGAKIKALIASIQSHGKAQRYVEASDDLDEIESLLEQGDEAEGDESQAEREGAGKADKGVAPGKAFAAKLTALMPKIREAITAGGDAGKKIKGLVEQAAQLAKTEKDAAVVQANDLLGQVEDLLAKAAGATAGGGLSVQKLATARLDWIKTRDTAISEITRLSKAIVEAYRGETDQQAQVKAAITKLAGLATRLKSGLDNELDAALSENDAARRVALAKKAKDSLAAIRKLVDEDELMKSLDGNEILSDMNVVGPMKARLSAIEAALG
jgi:hypothetical protein